LTSRDDGGTDKIYFRYDFTFEATTKDQEHRQFAYGDCSSARGIGCGVDCDGGGFELELVAGTKDSLLFRLGMEHGSKYIRMTAGCDGGPHDVNLTAGEDDKLFRLDKAPASVCETMQAEYDKLVQ